VHLTPSACRPAAPPPAPLPQVLPRKVRGLDYDLNWSLAGDALTTRGEAYRNAAVRDLLEFAGPRGAVRVTKERAAEVVAGPLAAPKPAEAFATDVFPGRKVMDVEEYEGRLSSVRNVGSGERRHRSTRHRARRIFAHPPPIAPRPRTTPRPPRAAA
jgi:hypothetical protein